MTTRVGNISTMVFDRSKLGSFRRVLIALVIISALLLYVGGKVKIVQLGYQLEVLERERNELEHENRSLRIEVSSLSAPARIERIAIKRLGMIKPAPENMVIVKRKRDAIKSNNQVPITK